MRVKGSERDGGRESRREVRKLLNLDEGYIYGAFFFRGRLGSRICSFGFGKSFGQQYLIRLCVRGSGLV